MCCFVYNYSTTSEVYCFSAFLNVINVMSFYNNILQIVTTKSVYTKFLLHYWFLL